MRHAAQELVRARHLARRRAGELHRALVALQAARGAGAGGADAGMQEALRPVGQRGRSMVALVDCIIRLPNALFPDCGGPKRDKCCFDVPWWPRRPAHGFLIRYGYVLALCCVEAERLSAPLSTLLSLRGTCRPSSALSSSARLMYCCAACTHAYAPT